jgi:hypothetical protein
MAVRPRYLHSLAWHKKKEIQEQQQEDKQNSLKKQLITTKKVIKYRNIKNKTRKIRVPTPLSDKRDKK